MSTWSKSSVLPRLRVISSTACSLVSALTSIRSGPVQDASSVIMIADDRPRRRDRDSGRPELVASIPESSADQSASSSWINGDLQQDPRTAPAFEMERQQQFVNLDVVPVVELRGFRNPLPIDERPISAAQVLDVNSIRARPQAGMVAGHDFIRQHQIAVGVSADRNRIPQEFINPAGFQPTQDAQRGSNGDRPTTSRMAGDTALRFSGSAAERSAAESGKGDSSGGVLEAGFKGRTWGSFDGGRPSEKDF